MNKFIKRIIGALAGSSMLFAYSPVFAEEGKLPEFASVSGTITQVSEYKDTGFKDLDGQLLVLVENEDGSIMNFRITEDTYLLTDQKPETGKRAIGFYSNRGVAIMIYPPQMKAVAFGVSPDESQTVTLGFFDDNLINEDNSLKLNIGEDTEIIGHDGTSFDGEIKNKNLAVTYTVTTRSIPAQTTPLKIVVLPDSEAPAVPSLSDEGNDNADEPAAAPNVSGGITVNMAGISVIANGAKIGGAYGYSDENGIMVPLRAAAEALGYTVSWNGVERSVTLDETLSLYIGRDYYTGSGTEAIELGVAPLLKEGVTYVPVSFFSDVAKIEKAEMVDLQIELVRK